jgi:hypothetical protein
MSEWQQFITFLFGIYSLAALIISLYQVLANKNIFGSSFPFILIGAFVWGDALIFGLFWIIISSLAIILHNWFFLLMSYSVFWIVRSIGETLYWLNQQFSSLQLNPPERFFLSRYFTGNSIGFIYQIFWQCITVISVVSLVYLIYFF